jgi:hypothetical protein
MNYFTISVVNLNELAKELNKLDTMMIEVVSVEFTKAGLIALLLDKRIKI